MVASAFKTKNGVRVWLAGKMTFAPGPKVVKAPPITGRLVTVHERKAKSSR